MSDRRRMTRADYMRQRHVALSLGFKVLDMVEVTGSFENPASGAQSGPGVVMSVANETTPLKGLGVVYSTHTVSKVASVAMACWEGTASTCIGYPFMRHYHGEPTAELITTLRAVEKLRKQLAAWAPPEKGYND
jgi:hypothetical protein